MLEQKIETLKNLFAQRDEIDRQIKEVLGGDPIGAKTIKKTPTKQTTKKEKKSGRKIAVCADCGKEKTIMGKGFCGSCYARSRKNEKAGKNFEQPESSASKNYKCKDCGHVFKSVLDYLDVFCPECKGSHILKLI